MPNNDNSKNDARSQHLNKHKKSQSQGLFTLLLSKKGKAQVIFKEECH